MVSSFRTFWATPQREMTTEARAYFQAGEKEHEPAYMEVDQEAMTDLQA